MSFNHFAWQAWDFVALRHEVLRGGLNRFAAATEKCCKTCRLEDVKSHFECGVWSGVCGVQSVKCDVQRVICEV